MTVNATKKVQVFTGRERMSEEFLLSEQPVYLCNICVAYLALCIFFIPVYKEL